LKKIVIILSVLLVVICAGCGTSVKNDLVEYVKFEQSADKEIQAVSSDFMKKISSVGNNKEEKVKLLNEVLKNLTDITEKQRQYKPQTQDVQDIHNKGIKALDTTRGAFDGLIQAVDSDTLTEEKIKEFNSKQQEINRLTTEYYNDIKALQEKNK